MEDSFIDGCYNPKRDSPFQLPPYHKKISVGCLYPYTYLWYQIWTSKYDSYVNELYNADNTSNLYTDSEGKKHLFISAGCPIVYLNKGELLTIDLEFEDKTKNYDVWFKYGTFNKVNANSDSNLVSTNDIYYGANKNTRATVGSQNKSIRVASGAKQITLEAKKSAYIFIKWSLSGNSGAGGGRFMPPSTVRVVS